MNFFIDKGRLAEIKNILVEIGEEDIDLKLDIIRFFWESKKIKKHISSENLVEIMKNAGRVDIEKSMVDETLAMLSKFGFFNEIRFSEDSVLYEYKNPGTHHDHMICVECGRIIEFEDTRLEEIQKFVAGRHDFALVRHTMVLYGLCSLCSLKRGEKLFLKDCRQGELMEVCGLKGGRGFQRNLASMGIMKGAILEILSVNSGGQLIVGCLGSRYVLGQGLTESIIVKKTCGKSGCMHGKNRYKH